jgi:hypothetical protein
MHHCDECDKSADHPPCQMKLLSDFPVDCDVELSKLLLNESAAMLLGVTRTCSPTGQTTKHFYTDQRNMRHIADKYQNNTVDNNSKQSNRSYTGISKQRRNLAVVVRKN